MQTAVFVICAMIVLGGGVGVISSRNTVHSALSLVATLFGIAVLFLNQDAQLLAAIQVIVYTGAIVVLILFVLMLLGVDREDDLDTEPLVGQRTLAAVVGMAIVGAVLAVIVLGGSGVVTGSKASTGSLLQIDGGESNIAQLGRLLFTNYVFALELTAALLTIAVVGAVMLSRRVRDPQPLPEGPASMTDQGDDPVTRDPEVVPAEEVGTR